MCPDGTRDLILEPSPIRRSKLHELVSQKLEDMIRSGELKPGDRLPSERDIMAAYGIGRPAVREAFLSLQSKGFITTESGRRARVTVPSVDNIFTTLDSVVGMMISKRESLKNLFDARRFIEAAMARQAAIVIDKVHLAELREALEDKSAGDWQSQPVYGDGYRVSPHSLSGLRQPGLRRGPYRRSELADGALEQDRTE